MKRTSGRAEPGRVKELLNERLSLSFIQVLSMGGTIATGAETLGQMIGRLAGDPELSSRLRFEEIEISRILSEEITPEDWAALIAALDGHLKKGSASGIVVAHGTDTLAYTASLLYWLFPRPALPVVLTAAVGPAEAYGNLRQAVLTASKAEPGIYVSLGSRTLSPLNLKFERIGPDGFRNWNMASPRFRGGAEPPELPEDRDELTRLLEGAINEAAILKVYPGMRGDLPVQLMEAGVRHFILELYDSGTANLRESPYSLRRAFMEGRERGVRFFCTSQQEGVVDFSEYITSHELWREGAIPMGSLTTESAFTRLIAARLTRRAAEDGEELVKIMEEANADLDR
jgi:aspartyl-tRNA(Asn)/glutamyl-tRNA(Gln) amidotransferase subunit B